MNADNTSVVRATYNSGITHFDTAHGYQNGRNEEMLGEFFADKPRDSFIMVTNLYPNSYFIINTTAYADTPSSRPVNPNFSVVVALMDMQSMGMDITCASVSCI